MAGVLVVEDDESLRMLFALAFEVEGFVVYQANDGLVALDILLAHQDDIALVVTDLGMPNLGGVDLISRIRATNATVYIIGISGFGANNVRDLVLAAGANDFLPKPLSIPDVISKVKSFIT